MKTRLRAALTTFLHHAALPFLEVSRYDFEKRLAWKENPASSEMFIVFRQALDAKQGIS